MEGRSGRSGAPTRRWAAPGRSTAGVRLTGPPTRRVGPGGPPSSRSPTTTSAPWWSICRTRSGRRVRSMPTTRRNPPRRPASTPARAVLDHHGAVRAPPRAGERPRGRWPGRACRGAPAARPRSRPRPTSKSPAPPAAAIRAPRCRLEEMMAVRTLRSRSARRRPTVEGKSTTPWRSMACVELPVLQIPQCAHRSEPRRIGGLPIGKGEAPRGQERHHPVLAGLAVDEVQVVIVGEGSERLTGALGVGAEELVERRLSTPPHGCGRYP